MIVRIVKLMISKEKTNDFCLFFNTKKTQIEEFNTQSSGKVFFKEY